MVQEGQMSSFATPQEKRPNRQTKVCLDGFEKSQLRNLIINFHVTEKCVPTLKKLQHKFCDEFGYLGGRETLLPSCANTCEVLVHIYFVTVPPGLANLTNLEILNLANNHIEELPLSLSSMPKLRILNLSLNRLYQLPRGFGAFPLLEVLDLTYNNLKEDSLPGNFFMIETLRALYLGDNDFEYLPPDVKNLKSLQILVLRENDLIELPKEIGELSRLRELHVQGNRLSFLPPDIGNLDMASNKSVFKFEGNEWVAPIADQLQLGLSHLMDYLRSETYRVLYSRFSTNKPPIPPCIDKSKKISRIR
ncbi:hypothetical protein JTB14_001684 [Gonioctena quinquepunctata]|nr:hypothetical protein JTB14_001684 [Gonioctena quinquepunctata]